MSPHAAGLRMRCRLVLLAFLATTGAAAQPASDAAEVGAAFGRIVALAHADSLAAALPLVACLVAEDDVRRIVRCDPALIEHRARAEGQLALVRRLFPATPSALRPTYTTDEDGGALFHVFLFSGLPVGSDVLVSFTDVDGVLLFVQVQLEDALTEVPPPPSVVAAFRRLVDAAADAATTVDTFAPLVVAADGERAWRAAADPTRAADRRRAEQILTRLRRLLTESGGYTVVRYYVDRESEGTWHGLTVQFGRPEDGGPVTFGFLPFGSVFLLGDIDGGS